MALTSKTYDARDLSDFMEMVYERGWTDGLPVFPPTDDKVLAMIDYLGRDPGEVVGVVPPGEGVATIEKIAITPSWRAASPSTCPSS